MKIQRLKFILSAREMTLLDSVSNFLEGFITLSYIAFIICLSKPDLS